MNTTAPPRWFDDVQPILDAVRILSPASFVFDGRVIDGDNQPPASREDDFFDPDPLMSMLHRHLYGVFHAAPEPVDEAAGDLAEETFLAQLSAANRGRDRWDEGWRVVETLNGGAVVAEKQHRSCRWDPGEFVSDDAPAKVKRDSIIAIRLRKESRSLQAGFYYAFGGGIVDGFDRLRSVRYYLNLTASGAAPVVGLVTGALGLRGIPFSFKCGNRPSGFGRRDSCVLYVAARHAQVTHAVLRMLYPQLAPYLRPRVPFLTLRLADGLAFAEDPAGDDSFGGHRMRAVAEGLIAAHRTGRDDPDGRRALVLERFSALRVDLEAPHLAAGAGDPFGLRRLRFEDDA